MKLSVLRHVTLVKCGERLHNLEAQLPTEARQRFRRSAAATCWIACYSSTWLRTVTLGNNGSDLRLNPLASSIAFVNWSGLWCQIMHAC